ncbi:hypothetical protein [Pseudomonas sp. TMP25]|uniref:hypothetical protein n=1 Tax=Pseudomonas sp. TMP25 TaxID=3136561 RepID=UPI0031011169
MEARFARAQARMNRVAASRLADALGSYQQDGQPPIDGLALQIDRGVDLTGAGDIFLGCTIAITFSKATLCSVVRGGIFTSGLERFTVEKAIADDGQWITAACMVMP